MTNFLGNISIPDQIIQNAELIKFENYKVNNPNKPQFEIHKFVHQEFMSDLANILGLPSSKLDFVYFSCCKGAEPHTDLLDPEVFTNTTYVIPVILPEGFNTLWTTQGSYVVHVGGIFEFDHAKEHSLVLEDTDSGCVVIMVSQLR